MHLPHIIVEKKKGSENTQTSKITVDHILMHYFSRRSRDRETKNVGALTFKPGSINQHRSESKYVPEKNEIIATLFCFYVIKYCIFVQ